jgi:hypothetical protein
MYIYSVKHIYNLVVVDLNIFAKIQLNMSITTSFGVEVKSSFPCRKNYGMLKIPAIIKDILRKQNT